MLSVHIRKHQGDLRLDVSFQVDGCAITAVFGPSERAKPPSSTASPACSGPTKDVSSAGGTPYFDARQGINLSPERRRVGYVFQDGRLFPHMSVRSNLLFGRRFRPGPVDGAAHPGGRGRFAGYRTLAGPKARHPVRRRKAAGGPGPRPAVPPRQCCLWMNPSPRWTRPAKRSLWITSPHSRSLEHPHPVCHPLSRRIDPPGPPSACAPARGRGGLRAAGRSAGPTRPWRA